MEITAPALGGAGAGAGTVSLTKSTTEKVANVASSKGIDFVAIEKLQWPTVIDRFFFTAGKLAPDN
jgi:hypothetical protein